ncbi:Crp/Fnr family transcriptional regulator [Clostridium beijerinckii]|uniref:Crp/Fnr family transcriptional regulator n=1 Tax=Clostridium beijerinckii TaxID=1520 RepID=UPI00098C8B4F|nr:Crp/Fnr family transcriptional regulator [Clostridium beijerinckii]MBA8933940.1 CRP-like cAMP-binding protein [Clostridium beijerinckii]NRT36148.1 CRP-like cAMP-binding protein [Clostridium beijerinckii]NRT44425.1 CRP-like cAMP-binding protein [Clostridium beijerinckii]NRU38134.1 CRP-like cAMP-binding protein [Clostridium beijerinckii]NRZ21583.1 CRP-like cAMP-binding protein [Clostridium beijerinckii]
MSKNVYDDLWINILKNNEILLSEKNIALLKKIFKPKILKKDTFFLQEGEKSTEIGVVVKGVFRSYYIDKAGKDTTKYFYKEGEVLFSYVAHLSQKESMYYIQALEDSEIIVAQISDFEKIVEGNYELLLFYKKMIDSVIIMKEEHAISFKVLDSIERYKQFLNAYPGLEKRIKQYHIASYLGMTPVSLSRLRKNLNINK